MVELVKKIVVFALILFANFTQAQINCAINITADTLKICEGESIQINTSGNPYKIHWSNKTGLSDSSIKNPIASPSVTTKYILSNRYEYPNERIINGDFELGDQDFTSQYGVDCSPGSIEEGYYCVNNTSAVYYSNWNGCYDHTSGGGNMMIINASTAAGVQLWCQNITVTPNTDYAFSTWISSVFPDNPALLQFTLNNTLLGDTFRATGNTCEWNEFFTIWNSGPTTNAQICVVNQNTLGWGNDFAMDDISFKPVCFSEDSVVVMVSPNVNVNLGADKNICNGDSILLQSGLPPNYIFQWSNGETQNQTYVTTAGQYILVADNGLGCADQDTIVLHPLAVPTITLEEDTTVCFEFYPSYALHSGGNANSYLWNTGETTPNINATKEGSYVVTLSNGKHCVSTDSMYIKNYCEPTYFNIPNAFTPNNDGKNEVFQPVGEGVYKFKMRIFNRWGELIFESSDIANGWDGKYKGDPAPIDIYAVYYEYESILPDTGKRRGFKLYSSVALIR
jgi:gliding motility-associated-like protein